MPPDPSLPSARSAVKDFRRYDRQMLLPQIGAEGQKKIAAAKVLVVGCGGLGTHIADTLARAGVGRLVLADRDVVELTNLQRQVLFDEANVGEGLPKAEAAKRRLATINSQIAVTAIVDDVNHTNIRKLATDCDLILDGLDNFETRYLLNDCAVKLGLPYIYGGAVGTSGLVYPVLPHTDSGGSDWEIAAVAGPCLRCIFEHAPPPGTGPTCDTAGVWGPLVAVVANLQAAEALKILTRQWRAVTRCLLSIDLWTNTFRCLDVAGGYIPGQCPCCGRRCFDYLDGRHASGAAVLCGQDAVQISPPSRAPLDLSQLAQRLACVGQVTHNSYVLRAQFPDQPLHLTLFADGRAIIKGTRDPAAARGLYAKYVGS